MHLPTKGCQNTNTIPCIFPQRVPSTNKILVHAKRPAKGEGVYAESKASPVKESSRVLTRSSSFPGNATSSNVYSTSAPGGILFFMSILGFQYQGGRERGGRGGVSDSGDYGRVPIEALKHVEDHAACYVRPVFPIKWRPCQKALFPVLLGSYGRRLVDHTSTRSNSCRTKRIIARVLIGPASEQRDKHADPDAHPAITQKHHPVHNSASIIKNILGLTPQG